MACFVQCWSISINRKDSKVSEKIKFSFFYEFFLSILDHLKAIQNWQKSGFEPLKSKGGGVPRAYWFDR